MLCHIRNLQIPSREERVLMQTGHGAPHLTPWILLVFWGLSRAQCTLCKLSALTNVTMQPSNAFLFECVRCLFEACRYVSSPHSWRAPGGQKSISVAQKLKLQMIVGFRVYTKPGVTGKSS